MKPTQNNPPSNKPQNIVQAMSSIARYGKDLLDFIALRPYLTLQLLFSALEVLFPIEASILTNEDIIREFLEDGEYRLKEVTVKQYRFHLRALNEWLGGLRFMLVTPAMIAKFIKGKTIKKREFIKDNVGQSTHDHLIDVYHNFYRFMHGRGYLCRMMPNPVQLSRITNRRKVPNPALIFSAKQYQHILSEVPWEAYPTAIMLMEQGIRPMTLPRIKHSDIKRTNHNIDVNAKISKCGKSKPTMTPSITQKLEPWENCTGPVSSKRLVKMVQDTIIRLGYRKTFNDDCRKTAISMRLAILRHENKLTAEIRATDEFGNDEGVRAMFYEAEQPLHEAQAYFAAKRDLPPVVLTVAEARKIREHQIKAAGAIGVALSEANYEHTHTSSKKKKDYIRRMAELEARENLSPDNLFPTFITVDGDWEITGSKRAQLTQEVVEGKQARVLETMNEIHAHEAHQLSIFHGRGDLFIESTISGAPCSPNQTASSPNNSSPNDTE